MYDFRPNLVLGFHGCDISVANKLLTDPSLAAKSEKPYDWLGHGIYFWENNLARACQWAEEKQKRGKIEQAAVIGAVLHLGNCLDFLDSKYIELVAIYYELMEANYKALGKDLPQNRDILKDRHQDRLLRELDCATIEFMHEQIFSKFQEETVNTGGFTNIKLFDSTRGVFMEGGEAFPGSAISKKSHIQICIRNLNCIKGFFLPRDERDFVADLQQEYRTKPPIVK